MEGMQIPGSRNAWEISRPGGKLARKEPESEVRILIRSSETKHFVGPGDDWSEDVAHAQSFRSALEAELFCRQHVSIPVELLVLRRERPPLTIPLKRF